MPQLKYISFNCRHRFNDFEVMEADTNRNYHKLIFDGEHNARSSNPSPLTFYVVHEGECKTFQIFFKGELNLFAQSCKVHDEGM